MSHPALNLHETSGAVISPCGHYQYRLWRRWSPDPVLTYVMLHPSPWEDDEADPVVDWCHRHAEALGFGALILVNLFAWRARDPRDLYRAPDPVGADNDWSIVMAAQHADLVLCGWGEHGALRRRSRRVLGLLKECGIVPHALHAADDHEPAHPLEVGFNATPRPICH